MENTHIHCDVLGNILDIDIPEYNIITRDDDIAVCKAKKAKQIEQYQKEHPEE